jgi:hypothetical protein
VRNRFDCCVETRYAESRVDRTSLSLLGSVSSLVCFSFWGGGVVSEEEGKKNRRRRTWRGLLFIVVELLCFGCAASVI